MKPSERIKEILEELYPTKEREEDEKFYLKATGLNDKFLAYQNRAIIHYLDEQSENPKR